MVLEATNGKATNRLSNYMHFEQIGNSLTKRNERTHKTNTAKTTIKQPNKQPDKQTTTKETVCYSTRSTASRITNVQATFTSQAKSKKTHKTQNTAKSQPSNFSDPYGPGPGP